MNPGSSLEQFLKKEIAARRVTHEIAATIECLVIAGIELAESISFSPPTDASGSSETTNSNDHIRTPLDAIAQRIFEKYLSKSPASILVSEELDDVMPLPGNSSLCVAIDPLDGSTNIDTNISIGSIFSIMEIDPAQVDDQVEAIDKAGQVAAGFFVYGPQTTLALSCGEGVNIFALNPKTSEFILIRSNLEIPNRKWEFAINTSNYRHWDSDIRHFVDDCILGQDGPLGADYNMRWNASLVAEAYRILMRGGVFLYPGDSRPGYRKGCIRLLYQAKPIAFMIEQAGGKSTDGFDRILDKSVSGIHCRIPLIFGSSDSVDLVQEYFSVAPANKLCSPLFSNRNLFRY
jgi:fructose-1,6-bisphosphatase I